ncbi:hypothetical protein EIN_184560 [Entamoeba invadens IP1]|uniref:hypothetical protein n=1 Tax=Entamoeba invadens IP1 TaxID=370355 RepID=UPI0002C3D9CD|nr:hypothetical protein EIN_184560 [Entamoeba invadens IP1]ELP94099.1 hypothetical protein EIN_184560 [Entamoeba invadens IP1]|eukprot:XP_004260870.1 hypothetical protein EIN_184560 [Entamoeba invadens IP1]
MKVLTLILIITTLVTGSLLNNPIMKTALGVVGIKIMSPDDIRGAASSVPSQGGVANFAMQPPTARESSEPSVLIEEIQQKVLDEVQRQFGLLLDLCYYGPYGIPIWTPIISPVVTLFTILPVMTAFQQIEIFRKQKEMMEYAKIAGMAMNGYSVARNLNLRHRVSLGTWQDTNPL